MSKEEINVVAVKNSVPDMRGVHLWSFLQLFGVPNAHGVFCGNTPAMRFTNGRAAAERWSTILTPKIYALPTTFWSLQNCFKL